MRGFLAWLKIFRAFSGNMRPPPRFAPEWEQSDAASLRAYLQTSTGAKLVDILRFNEAANNAGAVIRHDRHEYACGFAAGYRALAAQIGTLSEVRSPQETEQKEQLGPRGAADLVDSLAP